MRILAIDPGSEKSGWVLCDWDTWDKPTAALKNAIVPKYELGGECDNGAIWNRIEDWTLDAFIIECPRPIGSTVPSQVFETLIWIGRFIEWWKFSKDSDNYSYVFRKDVKMTLLGRGNGTDAQVNAALREQYAAIGGGATPQVGTKKQPGPLHGISKHQYPALAAAYTWIQMGCPIVHDIQLKGKK